MDALFKSPTLCAVIRLLMAHPQKQFFIRELARAVEKDAATVQRLVRDLERLCIVRTQARGKNKYVSFNGEHALASQIGDILRADGTFHSRSPIFSILYEEHWISPLTISANLNGWAALRSDTRFLSHDVGETATFFVDNSLKFGLDEEKIKRCSEEINEKLQSEAYVRRYDQAFDRYAKKTLRAMRRCIEVSAIDSRFIGVLRSLYDCAVELCRVGYVTVLADFPDEAYSRTMKHCISDSLRSRAGFFAIPSIVNQLSAPTEPSHTMRREEELLRLAHIAFQKGITRKKDLRARAPLQNALIAYHTLYSWTNFGHFGPSEDSDPADELADMLSAHSDEEIQSRLKVLKAHASITRKEQNRIFRDLKLNRSQVHLFRTAGVISHIKALRLELLSGLNSQLARLVRHISQVHRVERGYLYQCTLNELIDALSSGISSPLRAELKKRAEACVWLVRGAAHSQKILSGTHALDFRNVSMREHVADIDAKESFHGMVAYQGKARGRVKIVLTPRDMDKVQEGDILVSHQTVPELLPAMKRASAFVTNSGGITCHAAIVSREMKKPCIVGTKIATRLLKDGDYIEIDAYKGVVTIIKLT